MHTHLAPLWEKLAELYGRETLTKRFGETPPPVWQEVIGNMPDYKLQRGMRRLLRGAAPTLPSLPMFVKLCEDMSSDYDVGPGPDPDAPKLPSREWSKWEIEGNHKLLAHVRNMGKSAHPDSSMDFHGRVIPGPLGTRITKRLVAAKNAWVQDMAVLDPGNGVNRERQLEAWNEVMGAAMVDIASWATP